MTKNASLRCRRAAPTWAALAFCVALQSAWAKGEPAVPLDLSANPASASVAAFKSTDAARGKGVRRIAIPSIQIEFVTSSSASASATEIGRSGSAGVSATYKLVGVGGNDMQAIADRLLNDFNTGLAAAGFEVVSAAEVQQTASYRKLIANAKAEPMVRGSGDTQSILVGPASLPLYGIAPASGSGGVMSALAGISNVTGMISSALEVAELQKELNAAVLSLRLRVSFVDLESSSSSFLGRISGTASVKGKLSATLTEAALTLAVADGGTNNISLSRPLVLPGEAIKEVRDVSSVAANVGLAVLSMAIGRGGSQSVKEHEAVADPQQYREALGTSLGAVRAMLVARLSAER